MKKAHSLFMKTAFLFSAESKCLSKHVGAIIVKNNRIISTGVNGTPPDLPNCDDYFKKLYRKRNLQISFEEWIKTPEWRKEHTLWSDDNELHAEMNAIDFSAKEGREIEGSDIYVTISPCNHCLKNITMTGIQNVYYLYLYDRIKINPTLIEKVNVQLVPNSTELKKWAEKNNLLYNQF